MSLKKQSFTCDKLRVLTWENNSCYMDSVLFALFATPNPSSRKDDPPPKVLEDHGRIMRGRL